MANDKAFKVKNTLELAGYNTSIGVTAVDVFVYDTSKDSDGGAWRKRCQHTSWYNETLNTATRGGRREFPAVAVIVAEATKVTIYDGDDPALPMWMVFNTGAGNALYINSASSPTSVEMLNGELYVGLRNGVASAGLNNMSFAADTTSLRITSTIKYNVMSIAERNRGGGTTVDGSFVSGIVNRDVNDVAMTVLPDAPIDPATGLPVPTIAVATAGGVSVIKDDGTVVDLPTTGVATQWVTFNDRGQLVSQGNYGDRWVIREIPSSDVANLEIGDATFLAKPYRQYGQGADYQRQVNFGDTYASDLRNSKNGLLLEHGAGSALGSTSLVALTTSTYNTGWMNGDIKGAFLSDTDDTDLVGSGELVTNGTFDTDTSGWTAGNSTLSVVSGRLRVTNDGVNYGYAYQAFSTVVGKTYTVSVDINYNAAFARLLISTAPSPTTISNINVTASGTYTHTFVATATTTYVNVGNRNDGGIYNEFDNISVKLADADRSVSNNGLIVNGTVTRSPVATGAELVAYGGFDYAATKYLSQPYNSAIAFGTGDFCLMWWNMAVTTTSQTRNLLGLYDPIGGEQRLSVYLGSPGGMRVYINGAFALTLNNTAVPAADTWNLFAVVRAGGVLYLYRDGIQIASVANATAINTATTDEFRIGGLGSLGPDMSKFALVRISATAPSASQIKKIYEDEKVLFQENAACTLYGSSDAVTALAHDPDTGLLHVGTSAGRSVFQGLRRVSNTTTAVGTAISAQAGLVVEE